MSAVNPDTVVDNRYRILSRLGTGGMADVFLAEDRQLERQVALKLLHRRFAEDPGFVERFRREAQAAANLQHPNVVAVYDRGTWDGTYYIAMEYLQGRTLKDVVRAEAPLDPIRAIDITIQILKATRFAHRRGVIHRDLKPHNVMLDDQDHAKVADFGIARAGASDMTETGSIMGTAQYLSPEQAQGLAVGEGSDLYSIGIVLYELLTGRVPFDAESAVTIALKQVSEAPVPPTRYNPAIPPALEQTVLWALNKNPADRPENADAFINVLAGIRESLVSGGGGQVTASMGIVGDGLIGGAAVGAAGAAAAGVFGAGAAEAAPRPRVQLGAQRLSDPSTALHPLPGESGAMPTVGGGSPGGPGAPPPGSGQPRSRSRWSRIWPWLLGLLVLLVIGGVIAAFVATRPHKGEVPVVVNDQQSAATQAVEAAGFDPNIIPQASTEPSGTVIYQSPLGDTRADKGTTVNLTVSSGPGQTTVPPIISDTLKQATAELHARGLVVAKVLSAASSTVPKGSVASSDPDPGASLPAGQGVILYISSGVAPISVPTVTNDTLQTAQSALSSFSVSVVQQVSTQTPGTVLSQDPAGGMMALPGSTVTLTVAEKAPQVTVPDVVGQSLASAESTLSADKFVYKTTSVLTGVKADNHHVLAQTPSAGQTAAQGATVTLTVGKYSSTATTTGTTTTGTATGTATSSAVTTTSSSATGTGTGTSTAAQAATTTTSGPGGLL